MCARARNYCVDLAYFSSVDAVRESIGVLKKGSKKSGKKTPKNIRTPGRNKTDVPKTDSFATVFDIKRARVLHIMNYEYIQGVPRGHVLQAVNVFYYLLGNKHNLILYFFF